jgi:hypothetical protein
MRVTRRQFVELASLTLVARAAAAHAGTDEATDAVARRAADVIRGYAQEGFHRTATPVDRASADHLLSLARAAGVEPRLEPFELSRVDPGAAFLEIDGRRIDGLPMFDGPFTGRDGIRGAIGSVASDRPIAWIAISPSGEADLRKVRDGSPHRALIAVTTGQHPGLCPVNAAFFSEPFGPQVLQIGSEHQPVIERAASTGADVRVVAEATRRQATAFNVAAEVRGAQPDLPPLCVMTPRSGWYQNASERGGGLVCWLEAMRTCAAARPRRTVRFVASSGHELGHLGLRAYLAANPTLAREALVWMHYGANIGASTGDVGIACSSDGLQTAALGALAKQSLDGVRRVPASRVGGEAATIARERGQFVSFIGQNAWFHNPRDTWPDAVDVPTIARFARATADLTLALALS